MDLIVRPDGTAQFGDRSFDCRLGRAGIRADKTEGDGATPTGRYRLVRAMYRADRVNPPETSLPCAAIRDADGWCDAPDDPAYNTFVSLPYPARAETLRRDDGLYDLLVVTDHNADPVVPGAGSAIFVHVADPDGKPTEGCVAFDEDDLRLILSTWSEDDRLVIVTD